MASRARLAADDELSEIVRRRLHTLLAEIPPRRAANPRAAEAFGSTLASPSEALSPGDPAGGEPPWPLRPLRPRRAEAGHDDALRGGANRQHATPAREQQGPAHPGAQDPGVTGAPAVRSAPAWLPALGPQVRQFLREHLVVIGIIVLTGCLWGGYSLFQSRTTAVAVPSADASVQVSVTTPSASPTPTVLVHVLGEVKRPGVVSLPEGSRVQDALAAAGGLTGRAVPGELNLAARVSDGTQLVIGRRGSQVRASTAPGGTSSAAAEAKLDLNTATLEQLDTLPGVGPVTAAKIMAWREAHQRFRSVAELQEVDGIGPKTYAQIVPRVRV